MCLIDKIIKQRYKKSTWKMSRPKHLKPSDKRYNKYRKQLKANGFCDTELWNLNSTIAEFILPRLYRYRNHHMGYPGCLKSDEEWISILDDMIFAFLWSLECEDWPQKLNKTQEKKHWQRFNKGMRVFGKYFMTMWD
jgi:hypothetical protein